MIELTEEAFLNAVEAYKTFLTSLGLSQSPLVEASESARLVTELMAQWRPQSEVPHLSVMEHPGDGSVVVLKNLPFYSMCAHHFVPFFGTVCIEYIPNGKISGLGGFVRVIDFYARRPQFQENFTDQIAGHIMKDLEPLAVRVTVEARQMCLELQGHGSGIAIQTVASLGIWP